MLSFSANFVKRRAVSNLLHSIMVERKKVFLKKLFLALMGGKFSELRVEYEFNGSGIR